MRSAPAGDEAASSSGTVELLVARRARACASASKLPLCGVAHGHMPSSRLSRHPSTIARIARRVGPSGPCRIEQEPCTGLLGYWLDKDNPGLIQQIEEGRIASSTGARRADPRRGGGKLQC